MITRDKCVNVMHAGRPLDANNSSQVVRDLNPPQRLLYTRQNPFLFHPSIPAVQIPIPRPLQNGLSSSVRTRAWLCRIRVSPLGERNSMAAGPPRRVVQPWQPKQFAWHTMRTCVRCLDEYSETYLRRLMRTCLSWRSLCY